MKGERFVTGFYWVSSIELMRAISHLYCCVCSNWTWCAIFFFYPQPKCFFIAVIAFVCFFSSAHHFMQISMVPHLASYLISHMCSLHAVLFHVGIRYIPTIFEYIRHLNCKYILYTYCDRRANWHVTFRSDAISCWCCCWVGAGNVDSPTNCTLCIKIPKIE